MEEFHCILLADINNGGGIANMRICPSDTHRWVEPNQSCGAPKVGGVNARILARKPFNAYCLSARFVRSQEKCNCLSGGERWLLKSDAGQVSVGQLYDESVVSVPPISGPLLNIMIRHLSS